MKRFISTLAIIVASTTASHAAIIGVNQTGGNSFGSGVPVGGTAAEIIAAPEFVLDDNVTNTGMQGFNEAQGVFLAAALDADAGLGAIAAGQTVNSHMIFLNTEDGRGEHFGVEWTFDGIILGVMSNQNGSLEFDSTAILGALGTTYEAGPTLAARGLESNNGTGASATDGYSIFAPNSIRVSMEVTEPGDWIRVVTAVSPVPVPAAMPLLLAGLGGLGFMSRRKKRKAT